MAGGDSVVRLRNEVQLHRMQSGLISDGSRRANEQHYELPTRFFQYALGRRLKYAGRLRNASPAVGSPKRHAEEHKRLIEEALA